MPHLGQSSELPSKPWHFVPRSAIEEATVCFGGATTPLLKEEGHVSREALVSDFYSPRRIHRSSTRPGFTANDHPVNAFEIQVREGTKQWLTRQESAGAWNIAQLIDPIGDLARLDRHTHPKILRPFEPIGDPLQPLRSLSQGLIRVLRSLSDDFENITNEVNRDLGVE